MSTVKPVGLDLKPIGQEASNQFSVRREDFKLSGLIHEYLLVGDHEHAEDKVEHHAELHNIDGFGNHVLRVQRGLLVEIQEHELVDPVHQKADQEACEIQNGHCTGVGLDDQGQGY